MITSVIGVQAGSYVIRSALSSGGMGTVYRAEHTLIGRAAAVKVLNPEMSGNKDVVQRFFNEARATTLINHPGIVEVFDFGYLPSGEAYLVMELLEGQTLAQRNQQRGRVTEGEAASLLRGVCSALAAAHAKGITHRDLKPDNIFLVPDSDAPLGVRAKLLDFGIAKLTDVGMGSSATRTGAVMGTPAYMSPEQCKGTGDVDSRADLYSLGCILYELVAGRPPYVDKGAGELIAQHLMGTPDRPSKHVMLSPEMDALIVQLLAKQPAQRLQTAQELAERLSPIAQRGGFSSALDWEQLARLSQPVMRAPSQPSISPTIAGAPTTLSGAASQSVIQPAKKSRRALAIALGALAAGGVVLAVALSGGGGGDAPKAAAPAPVHVEVAKPVEAPPPPKQVEPPAPVVEPAPVEVAKPAVVPEEPKPVEKPKPVVEKKKPVVTPKKPTSKQPLLETDI